MRELPKPLMLGIATVQGLALYLLYHAFDTHAWPSKAPVWSFPMWTVAIIVPLVILLSVDRRNIKSVILQVSVLGAVLVLLAAYTGYQAEPRGEFRTYSLTMAFILSMTLATFKALMYLQQRANRQALSYPVLFTNSWQNFLVAALSALFVAAFWMVLMLWAYLFRTINIRFFLELFTEDWFVFPVLSFAFGLGVIIFRDLTKVIDSITRLLHWLFKLLLPLVVTVAVIFTLALPFTGLDVLWSTRYGTALLLWLLAVILFCTNAVYQDGREANPYPQIIHRITYIGICFTPVIAALSFYGLYLRLAQYGWSVERCWAFVVWFVFSAFAIGYVVGIVRRRDQWTAELSKVNTAMGLVVLAIMLLANSPLLDFRKISLASQLARIESGEIQLKDFDFWYTERHLARPGHLAMEQFKKEIGDSDPDLLALIESPVNSRWSKSRMSTATMWSRMRYRPEPFEVPEDLKTLINSEYQHATQTDTVLVKMDLDGNGVEDYLLLTTYSQQRLGNSHFYYRKGDRWQSGFVQVTAGGKSTDIIDAVMEGEIRLVEPTFKDVEIGDIRIRAYTIEYD